MGFLKGRADITDNLQFVTDLMMNPVTGLLIVNLDEDSQFKGSNVIGGAILLPPPEAIMAEIDGDEASYDIIYNNYFSQPIVQQYMMGIINYLYQGGQLIFYFPSLKNTETKTISKLLNMIYVRYGIGIGILNEAPGSYNEQYLPVWLNNLYRAGTIGTNQFLHLYPTGVAIDQPNMVRLVQEIKPYASNFQEQEKYIYHLIDIYKKKPNVKQAIYKDSTFK